MLVTKRLREYQRQEFENAERERITVSTEAIVNSADDGTPIDAHFEVRSPANSHLSTTMFLETTVEVQLEQKHPDWADHQWHAISRHMIEPPLGGPFFGIEINSPGFAIQNCVKKLTFEFNSASVENKPSEHLPFYSNLYRKSLAPYVRNSGRSFRDVRPFEDLEYDDRHNRRIH